MKKIKEVTFHFKGERINHAEVKSLYRKVENGKSILGPMDKYSTMVVKKTEGNHLMLQQIKTIKFE